MTAEEVIAAILACKEQMGRVPSCAEAVKHGGIGKRAIWKHFQCYGRALEACGLPPANNGRRPIELEVLFEDWAGVVRKLQKIPTSREYKSLGLYSDRPLRVRFGLWTKVAAGLKRYAKENGLERKWKDVIDIVTRAGMDKKRAQARILKDRPAYGRLIRPCPMLCKPTNEAGVMILFGAEALRLGFMVLHVQMGYPDCEAMREVGEDRLQRVRIEFEYESRNFLRHGHDVTKCDLIVCWIHNWPECPLEVVELNKLVSI